MEIAERFWKKVKKTDSCWIWTAGIYKNSGYGQFYYKGKKINAHRVAYMLTKGEIPSGMVIDHLCRNRACCNPAHLEAVTQRENILRGNSLKTRQMIARHRTHCPHGHEYTEENTTFNKNGNKMCRECDRKRKREKYWAKKAKITND